MQLRFLITAISFVSIFGCGTPKSSLDNASSGNEPIPSSFNPTNGVLLIEQSVDDDKSTVAVSTTTSFRTDTYTNYFMKKNKKEMVEYADKNYQYKHEFASQNEIYSAESKYSDKKKYQYALVTSLVKPIQSTKVNTDINTDNGQMQSTHYQPIFRFYLYDRLNDKTYSALSRGSSLIMWAYKAAIKKLNDVK